MKYQYFVSGRYRNKEKVLELINKIRSKDKTVFSFIETDPYHDMKEDGEEIMKEFESIDNWRENRMVKFLFKKDMKGIRNSKEFIMLLPIGKSGHIEAGVAYGLGKKCILIGQQKETESNYLIFSKVYSTIDDFVESLK
jgi:hypothetical protein